MGCGGERGEAGSSRAGSRAEILTSWEGTGGLGEEGADGRGVRWDECRLQRPRLAALCSPSTLPPPL